MLQSQVAALQDIADGDPAFMAFDGAGAPMGKFQEMGRHTHIIDMPGVTEPVLITVRGNGLNSGEPGALLANTALYFTGPNCTGTAGINTSETSTSVPAVLLTGTGHLYVSNGVLRGAGTSLVPAQSIYRIGLNDTCDPFAVNIGSMWEVDVAPGIGPFTPGIIVGSARSRTPCTPNPSRAGCTQTSWCCTRQLRTMGLTVEGRVKAVPAGDLGPQQVKAYWMVVVSISLESPSVPSVQMVCR
jgi:hypothetical protein